MRAFRDSWIVTILLLFALMLPLLRSAQAADYPPIKVFADGATISGNVVWGAQATPVIAQLVNGGLAPTIDTSWNGKIVLVDRGGDTSAISSIANKVNNVKNSGGVGVIIANNTGSTWTASMGTVTTTITAASVLRADGDRLRARIGTYVTIGGAVPLPVPQPPPVAGSNSLKINHYTGTHKLTAEDIGALVVINSNDPAQWVIPNDEELPTSKMGDRIFGTTIGAGETKISSSTAPGPSVSIMSYIRQSGGELKASAPFARWEAVKMGPNNWLVNGQIDTGMSVVVPGQTITFVASHNGTAPPYSYQWRRDGADISGQTQVALVLYGAELLSGDYTCNVGPTVSGPYKLVVKN